MKKFLTVLLVVAVLFTFSFSSAFAAVGAADMSSVITKAEALSYAKTAYENALKSLSDDVEAKVEAVGDIDALDGGYTTANGNYVSKTAYEKTLAEDTVNKANKAIVEAVYAKVVAAINQVANADDFGGFVVGNNTANPDTYNGKKYYGFDVKGTTYTTSAQKVYQVTYAAVKDYSFGGKTFGAGCIDATNFDQLAYQNEFAVKKEAALKGLAAIDLDVYSKEYNKTEKSNYDKASDDVTLAVTKVNEIKITTGAAGTSETNVKKAIDAIADIYTPAVGKAKAAGKLYAGGRTTALTAVSIGEATFTGLNNITKVADQGNADADLAYAQKVVLNSMLADLAAAEESVISAQNAILRAERDAEKPDADKIAEANNEIAKTEAAYEDAVAAIKYIVAYVDDYTMFGTFGAGGFTIKTDSAVPTPVEVWSIKAGTPTTYAGFKALEIYTGETSTFTGDVFGQNYALTIAICEDIADIVEDVNKAAENDKVFVNLDGSYAVQIEKALEKAIENAYINAINTYSTPTNTSELTARKHELIDAGKVTIAGKVYADTVMDWFAEADSITTNSTDTYDKELNDEIRAIVKETKDAIKAAATIADADAAFLAGFAKYDALMTAKAHYNAFALKSGALYEKYNKYVAQFTNYATASWNTIVALKKDTDYSVANLTNLVTYYVGTGVVGTGAFYEGIYDEAALDAVYAEALAAVDGLKTKAQIKEMADAAVTAINAISDKATIADKAAVAAAWDAYYAYADYAVDMLGLDDVFTVDATYVKAYDKLVLADKEVKKAEQKAIKAVTDLFPAATAKVTVADKDNVAKVRELVDAYVNDYVGKDAANTRNYATGKKSYDTLRNEALVLTGLNYTQFCAYERAVAQAQIDAVDEMIAKLAVSPVDEAAVKAAREAYDAIPENVFFDYGMGITPASYDKLVALEKVIGMDDEAAKAYVQDLGIKARSAKTAKGVKVTIKADVQELLDNGYTVEYKFYRSTKSNKGFKAMVTKTTGTYTNTKGVKGTKYYYKAKLVVKNAAGEVVATTPLTQCLYATRTF